MNTIVNSWTLALLLVGLVVLQQCTAAPEPQIQQQQQETSDRDKRQYPMPGMPYGPGMMGGYGMGMMGTVFPYFNAWWLNNIPLLLFFICLIAGIIWLGIRCCRGGQNVPKEITIVNKPPYRCVSMNDDACSETKFEYTTHIASPPTCTSTTSYKTSPKPKVYKASTTAASTSGGPRPTYTLDSC